MSLDAASVGRMGVGQRTWYNRHLSFRAQNDIVF